MTGRHLCRSAGAGVVAVVVAVVIAAVTVVVAAVDPGAVGAAVGAGVAGVAVVAAGGGGQRPLQPGAGREPPPTMGAGGQLVRSRAPGRRLGSCLECTYSMAARGNKAEEQAGVAVVPRVQSGECARGRLEKALGGNRDFALAKLPADRDSRSRSHRRHLHC